MIVLWTGCNEDYLDVTNPNDLTTDQFWQDEEDVNKAITALYATMQIQEWSEQWDFNEMYHVSHEAKSDLNYWQIWQPVQSIARYQANPAQYMTRYLWKWCYQMIFTANQILENLDKVEGLDAGKKSIYAAEA